jgi:hypothetical protein
VLALSFFFIGAGETTLTGLLSDQAALLGILIQLQVSSLQVQPGFSRSE